MKTNYFFYILILVSSMGFAQCIGTFAYPSDAVLSFNDGNVQEIAGCNFGGDFATINGLIAGADYQFSSDNSTDYLTLTDESDQVIASGVTPLTVIAIANVNVRLHIHSDENCGTASGCRATSIQCISCTPPPAPDCATNPNPADGAVGVPYGEVTFSWEAPAAGPAPTSYNLYAGETPTGDDYGLIVSVTTTSADLVISAYDLQLYWIIKPVNGTTEASGCPIWSFTTEMAPDPPSNDDVCNAISLALGTPSFGGAYYNTSATIEVGEVGGSCWFAGDTASESVWFSFVAPPSGEVRITTIYDDGSLDDTQLTLYSLTDCSDLSTAAELGCDEDDDTDADSDAGIRSLIDATGLTAGNTYYVQVDGYDDSTGTFDIGVFDLSTLAVNLVERNLSYTYFPNPVKNELTIKAQRMIETISIYNMLGQEVLKTSPEAMESNVNMNQLQTGPYFVKVTINDIVETIKIIKE